MPSLCLRELSKNYSRSVQAVRDVSLDIAEGELVVIVGPSGSGKSTLLRLIAGLETPTTGDILLDGKSIVGVPPSKRGVAMAFQEGALYPHLSVRGNLAYALKKQGLTKEEINQRVESSARKLGVHDLLERKPHELSGGESQRVGLGRAMAAQPRVLLLDEPLSNLDAMLREQLRQEIARLHQTLGGVIFYVTHDQREAMTLADRMVVLHHGVVQQAGLPMGLYRQPANRFVAGFLGEPGMNFFAGTISDGRFRTADGDAQLALSDAPPGQVVLGVRPEDLLIATGTEEVFATAQVERLEPLGHESLLRLSRPDCTVRVDPQRPFSQAEPVALTVRPGQHSLFSSTGEGERIG